MRRREFIGLITGAAGWAVEVRAQQTMRRVSVIMVNYETDPLGQSRLNGFLQGIKNLGWREGSNVHIDVRWAGGDAERMREIVAESVAAKPDVIVANGTPTVAALKRATSSIPIVFVGVNEPVVQGFIASMARPGGNITGFTPGEFSVVGKSLEMLSAMVPTLAGVGLMYNPETYGFYDTYLDKLKADARWSMELTRATVRVPADIDVAVGRLAERPGAGLAVLLDAFNTINQATIQGALERYRLPHIVPWRQFVATGGLMSYGTDVDDIFRRSADYVDRILKGTNPAQLPAQNPTRYELVINRKKAKALGLTVPDNLIALADDVID